VSAAPAFGLHSRAAVLALVAVLAVAASATPGTYGTARHRRPPPPHPRPTVALGAHESEYHIRLTRQSVPAGRVVLEMANLGQDPHDLNLVHVGGSGLGYAFGQIGPGTHRTRTVALSAGTWRLWCSLPGHEAKGMHATLRVNAG
jgi:hypothetical protein